MIQITPLPDQVIKILNNKGITEESIKITVKSDMNRDYVYCDNWLIATDTDLICIGGSSAVVPGNNKKKPASNKLDVEFKEISHDFFSLDELTNFNVENMISSAWLTAKIMTEDEKKLREENKNKPKEERENKENKTHMHPGGNGGHDHKKSNEDDKPKKDTPPADYVLITYMTNAAKNNILLFIKYLNKLLEGDEIVFEEKDKAPELFCPKCGNRYANAERKICPRCMDKSHIIRRTAEFFIKYKIFVAVILLMIVISSALGVLSPYISAGFYYDEVLDKAGKFYGEIFLVLGIILVTRIFSMIINVISGVVSANIASKIVYDLKKVIFGAIERLSISFFTNRQTGGLMTQVNNDANTIYWFFVDGFPYFVINIVQVITILGIMMFMNPILTLISIIIIPAVAVSIRILFEKMGKLHAKRYSSSRSVNSILSDVLSGVRVVKAFSKEKDEIERFNVRSRRLAESQINIGVYAQTRFPAISLLIYISSIVIWGVGGWFVIKGSMSYGILLTFVAYTHMIYNPMFFFVDMIYMLSDALNSMHRLIEVMDAVPDVVESKNPVPTPEINGKVTFNNIEFSYEKNRKIIDDISFEIEAGKVIGIVGHTGAGKSTLANLLIRLYDVNEGSILIDDVNIKDISFKDLRQHVSIVSQETYLFAGTIYDNIRYAKPEATYMEIIEAAKTAGAHDFIIKLPDAYATMIGFGYKDLSGGERQRVSIARAILRNPKILIMDEATAAMDTETERKIQTALERLVKGRTTIMIAHRLSTLRNADKLIVIENGKMPEFGTHLELINKKGIYYNLYKLQMDALKNIGVEG